MRFTLGWGFWASSHRNVCRMLLGGALAASAASCAPRATRMSLSPQQTDVIAKYERITGKHISPGRSLPFYTSVDAYMGVPYRMGGTTRSGMDCSGYVCVVYKEAYAMTLPRTSLAQYKAARRVGRRRLKEGNLVFFKIEKGKKVSHVGLYLGGGKFAHASTSKGVRVDDLNSDYYRKHFKKGGRMR